MGSALMFCLLEVKNYKLHFKLEQTAQKFKRENPTDS
jgi:hypothetical protein